MHTATSSRPYLPTLLWGYNRHWDRPEDFLEIKSTWDLKLSHSEFFLKDMKCGWRPGGKSWELNLKALLQESQSLFLTTTKIMGKESEIDEGSEQFSIPNAETMNHQKEWWRERTGGVWKHMPQVTLPVYVSDTDHWGEACQKVLNRH